MLKSILLHWLCVIPFLVFCFLVAPNLIDSGFNGWIVLVTLGIAILLLTVCLVHSIHRVQPESKRKYNEE